MKFKRKVCQMLIKIHIKRVWTILSNGTKNQSKLNLSTQKKTFKSITTRVKKNQSKSKTKMTLTLLTKTFKVRKIILTSKKSCVTQRSSTQKIRLTTTIQRTYLMQLKKRKQSYVNFIRRVRKKKWKSTQIMYSWKKIMRTYLRFLTIRRMLTQTLIEFTITTLKKKQSSKRTLKIKTKSQMRKLSKLQLTTSVYTMISQIIPNLWK